MQGKERNQSRIDTPFTDHAWTEMRKMLDREMPVAPAPASSRSGKSYALLLLFLLFGFIAGVGTMLLIEDQPAPEVKESPREIASLKSEKAQTAEAAVMTDLAIGGGGHPDVPAFDSGGLNGTKTAAKKGGIASRVFDNTSDPINSKQNLTLADDQNLYTNSSLAIVNTPIFSATGNQKNNGIPVKTDRLPDEKSPVRSFTRENDPLDLLSPIAVRPESDFQDLKLAFVPQDQREKMRFGFRMSTHTRQFTQLGGISAGAYVSIPLEQNFAFESGLQYTMLCGYQKDSDASQINDSPFLLNEEQVNLDHFATIQPLGANKNLPITRLHYVDLPLLLTYKLAEQFKIQMGVKASYLVSTKADEDESHSGGSVSNPNTAYRNDRDLALYESMKKLDFGTVLGIGYYPAKNLGFDFRYNHGLIDNTIDEAWKVRQITTNKSFELALTYLIGSN